MWREIVTCVRFEWQWLLIAIALGIAVGALAGPAITTIVDIIEDAAVA